MEFPGIALVPLCVAAAAGDEVEYDAGAWELCACAEFEFAG